MERDERDSDEMAAIIPDSQAESSSCSGAKAKRIMRCTMAKMQQR